MFGSRITKYDAFNYEQILRADHGRCLGYEVVDKNNAKPLIDQEHNDAEVFEKYVKEMQNQIFDKFELIAQKALSTDLDVPTICTVYFYHTVKNKTKTDYKWIIDMQDSHHDDFGYVGYPGRVFARWLRKFAFSFKDKMFICNNRCYARKLRKKLLTNQKDKA